jgi:predicted secreted protein
MNLRVAYFFFFSTLLIGFNSFKPSRTLVIDDSKKNADIRVKSGEEFLLKFKGIPSAGYSWFLDNRVTLAKRNFCRAMNLDEHGTSASVESTATNSLRVGTPTYFNFQFRALKKTIKETLTFTYKRPWETDTLKTVSVFVRID